jgi:hypothetical protein
MDEPDERGDVIGAVIAKSITGRNCFQVGPVRCGEGSIPAALRILQTVEAATV